MKRIHILIISLLVIWPASYAHAFWVWTPQTNRWVNPKYSVKETPKDQLQYALEAFNAKQWKKARDEFDRLIKYYPRAREAADAQYYIAVSLENEGKLVEAFRAYQRVIEKYPFSERSGEVVKRQYDLGNQMLEGNDKRSQFVKTVIGGDYDVIEIFRAVIKNAPYGEYAAPSQYKIGLYLQEKQLYQEARDEFEKTINDYPSSEWAKAARYQIAVSDAKRSSDAARDQKVTEAAIDQFKSFVQDYPDADLSDQAKDNIRSLKEKEAANAFLVAQFYEKQKKVNAAKVYYHAIVEDYANTTWASKALERLRALN